MNIRRRTSQVVLIALYIVLAQLAIFYWWMAYNDSPWNIPLAIACEVIFSLPLWYRSWKMRAIINAPETPQERAARLNHLAVLGAASKQALMAQLAGDLQLLDTYVQSTRGDLLPGVRRDGLLRIDTLIPNIANHLQVLDETHHEPVAAGHVAFFKHLRDTPIASLALTLRLAPTLAALNDRVKALLAWLKSVGLFAV